MGGSATSGKNYEWHAPGAMGWNGGKTNGAYSFAPRQVPNPQGNAYGFRGTRPPQAQGQPQIEDPAMPAYDPTQDTGFSPNNNIPMPPPGMFQQRPPIADGNFDMSQVQNLPATMPQQAAPQRPQFSFNQPVRNLLGNTLNMRPRPMR